MLTSIKKIQIFSKTVRSVYEKGFCGQNLLDIHNKTQYMVLFPTLRHMEKLRLPMANGALLSKYTNYVSLSS